MSTELGGVIEAGDGQYEVGVSISRQHLVLANPYRRLTIRILEEQPAPITLDNLADQLARLEATDDLISGNLEEISILLHHCHLPKLDAYGIIEYDRADRTVTLG